MTATRIIITGGGTGGHIFPAVAIGHALLRMQPDAELLFVGALGKMEMEKVPQEGFKIVGLDIAGFNRTHLLKNITLPFKLIKSRWQCIQIMKSFKPQVVVGVGGYASFPMLYAAQTAGIPTLVQEQNSFAGKSNIVLGKRANYVCVAYPHMDRFFPAAKLLLTGNPVRHVLTQALPSKAIALQHFGLQAQVPTLLIVGGSLGAVSINNALAAHIDQLLEQSIQILWQTGKQYYQEALALASKYPRRVVVQEFIKEMQYAYAAADYVVSRAGALAVSELSIVAKPVIFVPYPHAAEDHQTSNAQALVQKEAAWLVPDHEAKDTLVPKIIALSHQPEVQSKMSAQLRLLAITDADERIAKQVLTIAKK